MIRPSMAAAVRFAVAILFVLGAACAPPTTTEAVPGSEPPASVEPGGSVAFGADLTCPGDRWPPDDLRGIPGITAVALDRTTVEIANHTSTPWSFRLDAWEVARLEACLGLLAQELARGPLAPGAVVRATVGSIDSPEQPLTVSFWDRPCGEACNRAPEHPMLVERSSLEPGSS